MNDIKKAIRIASQNPKLAQVLVPLIEAYIDQENKVKELEMRVASDSRAQKKDKSSKSIQANGA